MLLSDFGMFGKRNGGKKVKKKVLALVLILIVSGISMMSFSAYAADSGLTLSATSIGEKIGDYTRLFAYSGSSEAAGVIWTSADETVATVDSEGRVTGRGIGQTVVTAYAGSSSARCVVNVAYKGIDVSAHQASINWASVKSAGIDFAMIRTGYGSEAWDQQTDKYFEANYSGAKANGIKVGVYHYSYATSVSMASDEADFCLHILNGRQLDYPVAYDVEDKSQLGLSTDTLGQMVQAFCSKIQAAGYKTVVYSYYNFYNAHLTSPLVAQYDTWIAHTGVDSTPFSPYTMWQYGWKTIPGISGSCDSDYSYYDYSTGTGGKITGGGTGGSTPSLPETSEQIFTSDTTGTYTFGAEKDYYYKITTNDTMTPSAISSNPSAVSVSYYTRLADGFKFKLTNNGAGQAVITTVAANGTKVSFTAVGSGSSAPSAPPADSPGTPDVPGEGNQASALKCDTTLPYHFGSNGSYIYKVYSTDPAQPKAVSSNPSAVAVSFYQKTSDGYLYRITNVGSGTAVITTTAADGAAASFTAYGTAASMPAGITSDTPYLFNMKKGNTYVYKFTPASGSAVLSFSTGNGAVISSVSVQKSGGSYYYKIQAAGSGQAGVYAAFSGQAPQRVGIVTVA